MVRENLANIQNGKVIGEYQEVAPNLYIRVLQDLERNPHAALIVDLSGDPGGAHQGAGEGEAGRARSLRDRVATTTPMARR